MKIDDKVVCVASFSDAAKIEPGIYPQKGKIYTIDGVKEVPGVGLCYYLIEISWLSRNGKRVNFAAIAFRPLTPLEAWNRDEQESYLEYLEKIAPGVERETVER